MLPIFTRRLIVPGMFASVLFSFCLTVGISSVSGQSTDQPVADYIQALNQLGPEGQNHQAIIESQPELSLCDAQDVITLLKAMKDEHPLAANWMRLTAQAVGQRTPPSPSALRQVITDRTNSDLGRLAAYQLLDDQAPQQASAMAAEFRTDACLPLRRIAIAQELERWQEKESVSADDTEPLLQLLTDTRDIEQIDALIRLLKSAGHPVNRNQWLGMQLAWQVVGPFDNTGGEGFAKAFAVEQELSPPDFQATFRGKNGQVEWQSIESQDDKGFVDINQLLEKHNGACVYLATNIKVEEPGEAQIRMGTYNAVKAWVNGEQKLEFDVYHTNEMVDQYVADVSLKAGDNWVVIKLCQNEQKESWAQNWRFVFRVTDRSGKKYPR